MKMNEEKALLVLYTAASVHPGAGSALETVDLPVQREVHTAYPFIASTGLKGSLREKAESIEKKNGEDGKKRIEAVFGPESGDQSAFAGCLCLGDGRLLAIPVRSLQRTFYWVSCPLLLGRFQRDAGLVGLTFDVERLGSTNGAALGPQEQADRIVLEHLEVEYRPDETLKHLVAEMVKNLLPDTIGEYFRQKFQRDFLVVSDEDFSFLIRRATQVSARIALNERKTTSGEGGNLWYEETIPPETIFYSLVFMVKPRGGCFDTSAEAMAHLAKAYLGDGLLRVGGNETVGQGWCLIRLVGQGGRINA